MSPAEDKMLASHEQHRTVLIVEDEVLLRLALSEELRERGYEVVEAASGDEARSLVLAGVAFDLVITDITMPGTLDGVRLAKWLVDNEVAAPVLFTSGMPSALDQARQDCPTAKAFIPKPYLHEDVLNQIDAVLKPRA